MSPRFPFVSVLSAAVAFAWALAPSATSAAPPDAHALYGDYGGEHAGASFYDFGANVELDCASGWIDGTVFYDATGSFRAVGTLLPVGQGAPERATYRGRIDGDQLTLEIVVGDRTLGPFVLRSYGIPLLDSCLPL
jgi:hypothetical protein